MESFPLTTKFPIPSSNVIFSFLSLLFFPRVYSPKIYSRVTSSDGILFPSILVLLNGEIPLEEGNFAVTIETERRNGIYPVIFVSQT